MRSAFGVPLDASLQPDMLKLVQESKSPPQEEAAPKEGPSPRGGMAIDINRSLATESADIEKGVE
jgi:hypothetical protein